MTERQPERHNSGGQAQRLMDSKGSDRSGDVSFWKNKFRDLQEVVGELMEKKQKLSQSQKCWYGQRQELMQHICELEAKDDGWKTKVMQLEKENMILAQKVNSWERKVKHVELQIDLAEKHERWMTRVYEIKQEKKQGQMQTLKCKVKEFLKENAPNVDQNDGQVQAKVNAQQEKYEELMEKQQSLDQRIQEANDRNCSLAKKVDELERKVKQLEEEKQLGQNVQRWEKETGELKEDERQPETEPAEARVNGSISADHKEDKGAKRKVGSLKEKKTVASIVQTLQRKIEGLRFKAELAERFQRWKRKAETRETPSQEATLGEEGRDEGRNKSSGEEQITTE